ncbi:ATP-binding cassette domain-containing protein [Enterococcus sp. BWR-S5]|uniref:ATP-binding cassette domain-containing protein n=1 Tax=Enterococcus sp. BWR-S5 TaxID=2787714 RepID=UPI001922FFED|nr:ATP-binding cassette domain-containing protein [Enterococcus sp. BWR-S5]
MRQIKIKGARTGNLKNIDVEITKHQINVFVGVSGSGKSSLVFNTIAAEAQRQMNETYPSYVRNRMPHLMIPEVDRIENLSPAVIVNQKPLGDNRRSTVGTATDINPTLRLLFSRFGTPFVGYSDVFSFNNPAGMCPTCEGLGNISTFRINELLDMDQSLNEGAIRFESFEPGTYRWKRYVDSGLFNNDKKIKNYTKEELELLLYSPEMKPPHPLEGWYNSSVYEGVIPRIKKTFIQSSSKLAKKYQPEIQRVTQQETCPDCNGFRLNEKTLSCKINGKHLGDCLAMQLDELKLFLEQLKPKETQQVTEKIIQQLDYFCQVGLDYLSLSRETGTLSGGESQRIKLIRSIGSSLSDMLYILDEPSTGLHPQDMEAIGGLIQAIKKNGNTLLLIDHDPAVIQLADTVYELGPGAGRYGGQLLGSTDYLEWEAKQQLIPPLNRKKRGPTTQHFIAENISKNNVQNISVKLPLHRLLAITGVAGSGKSSFAEGLRQKYDNQVFYVNQKRIRTSSRSTIASYVGVLDDIRKLFGHANQVAAGYFSFNGKGACPVCRGKGYIETELAFLEAVRADCEQCGGKKFRQESLSYFYHEKNIAEVLELSVTESLSFFSAEKRISDKLHWLDKIGLGYLTLGQTLDTLSGGELQRLKLACNLDCREKIIILDEPTSGLSLKDTQSLINVFEELLNNNNTLYVIEHNTALIKEADWMIEFGPGSGKNGGTVLFEGPPEAAVNHPDSVTGRFLT